MSSSAHFIPIVCSSSLSTISLLLQGTPSNAHFIPMRAIFLPIILLQVAALSFAVWRFFDRLLTKLQDGIISQGHISVSSKVNELFMMIQYGSRFYLLFNTTLSIMFSNCTLLFVPSEFDHPHCWPGSFTGGLLIKIAERNRLTYAMQITLGIHCKILISCICI
jgi:hypothetical protein